MSKNTQNLSAADDRLRRGSAPEMRGDRGVAEDAMRTDETGLTESHSDLYKLIESEFDQTALPTPPALPGWHLCWLTTGSQYDTLAKRQRLGYTPVNASELPGFEPGGMNSAAFEGAVTCNEMVLFKIPEARYQAIMQYFHHNRPLSEEEAIYAKIEELQGESEHRGKTLATPEEGFTQLNRNIARAKQGLPVF